MTMNRRQEVLAPLTREHRRLLAETRGLRLAADGWEEARRTAVNSFVDFVENDGVGHFRMEEGIVLPRVVGEPEGVLLVMRLMREHIGIYAMVRKARDEITRNTPTRDMMISLAETVESHVRFEELVVFPFVDGMALGVRAQAKFALCCRCYREHADHDLDGELFETCIPCQAEAVEAVLQPHDDP